MVIDSVQTIYEDRLVVQDLIFSYGRILDYHENLPDEKLNTLQRDSISAKAQELEEHYSGTVLTEEEATVFNSFSGNLDNLLRSVYSNEQELIRQMKSELLRLEQIQMEEASHQMLIINKTNGRQKLGFYLETAVLVVLLVILQAMVMSNSSIRKIVRADNFNLN